MDIQFTDKDGLFRNVMQHDELERLLNYAEKWTEISNNVVDNNFVMATITSMRRSIKKWKALTETEDE